MHLGSIGALLGGLLLLFLIPTVFGWLWWLVKFIVLLPFRLIYWIFVVGIGGVIGWIWRMFSSFFSIFGWFGSLVKWLIVLAALAFAGLFVYNFIKALSTSRNDTSQTGAGSSEPPSSNQRAWALGVLGLEDDPSAAQIKDRWRELMRTEHPDRLGPTATAEKRAAAQRRIEQINKAFEILTR